MTPPESAAAEPEVKSLICEGDCNPDIRDIDAQITLQRLRERGMSFRRMFPISGALADRIRHLQYTPHERRGPSTYVCIHCGSIRRF
jgi:hypothetical protein